MKLALIVTALSFFAGQALAAGPELYKTQCAACHAENGRGKSRPMMVPPLTQTGALLSAPGGREYLVNSLLHGVQGTLKVGGKTYNGMMPGFAASLSSAELAELLNYLSQFGPVPSGHKPFTPAEVAARAKVLTPDAVLKARPSLK